ncbi:MAG: type VI secretion system protein TssA [Planctomycetota bacterium]|jgi:type VI secretion system protein VasJ
MAEGTDLSRLGSTPVPGEKPTGAPCRYEPEFEALSAEIDKLDNPSGGEMKISVAVDQATTLLSTKSKDMLVAAYLAFALLERDGYPGFLTGLTVLRDLMKTFWEDCFPEKSRMRARVSSLEWLVDKSIPRLNHASLDPEALKACLACFNEIETFSATAFDESDLPSLRPLAREMEGKLADMAPAEEAVPEGEAPQGSSAAPGQPAGPRGPIASRAEAYERLAEVAAFLKKTEPHSPVIYLIERAVRWKDQDLKTVIREMLPQYRDAVNLMWQQFGLERED